MLTIRTADQCLDGASACAAKVCPTSATPIRTATCLRGSSLVLPEPLTDQEVNSIRDIGGFPGQPCSASEMR
jgi:hypothetical protein